jgi:hypothetical protein
MAADGRNNFDGNDKPSETQTSASVPTLTDWFRKIFAVAVAVVAAICGHLRFLCAVSKSTFSGARAGR